MKRHSIRVKIKKENAIACILPNIFYPPDLAIEYHCFVIFYMGCVKFLIFYSFLNFGVVVWVQVGCVTPLPHRGRSVPWWNGR